MTQPKLARSRSGREYVWPARPPHELVVPNVTGILNNLPTPWQLERWKIKKGIRYVLDHHDALSKLPPDDATKFAADASSRFTEFAADRGTIVHTAIETYLGWDVEREVPAEASGYVRAGLKFLADFAPKILHTEATIFNREHGYAGTADILARFWDDAKGEATIVDWKTSKDVREKNALQLGALARGDFVAGDDGKTEISLPKIRRGVVVILRSNGDYVEHPFEMTDDLFRVFLAAKEVGPYEQYFREARSEAMRRPPEKKAA